MLIWEVDLGEPTSFLDHVYLGCTQRECKISIDFVASYRDMFESRISAGAKEQLPTRASGKPDARKEMCGQILRICEYNDSTIIQSCNSMHG